MFVNSIHITVATEVDLKRRVSCNIGMPATFEPEAAEILDTATFEVEATETLDTQKGVVIFASGLGVGSWGY